MFDPNPVTHILFDTFQTIFPLTRPYEERKAYSDHIKKPWAPLTLPKEWQKLPIHPDAKEGLERLRTRFTVCTLSNGPLNILVPLSKYHQLSWDCIIPLEFAQVFKPNLEAYEFAYKTLGVTPWGCLMVSANKDFGDIEAARVVGMQSALIRHEEFPSLLDLCNFLGV